MPSVYDVAVFVGSLRKESINRKVAITLLEIAPPSLKLNIVEIGDLPLYNQDEDANPPAAWIKLRQRVQAADAVLFVTPEHNRSVPAALKNTLDVASRPYGQKCLERKTRRGDQRLARTDRWIWREPSLAAVAGIFERFGDAAA